MMSASDRNNNGHTPPKRPKRSLDNCDECRRHKKRCEWEDSLGRRLTECLDCTRKKRPCSGPINIRDRPPPSGNALQHGSSESQTLSGQNPREQSLYRQANDSCMAAAIGNRLSRPLDGMPEVSDLATTIWLPSGGNEGLSIAPRNTSERQCKEGLKQMADLKAAKYQILRYLHLLKHYRDRGGGDTDIEETLHSLHGALAAVQEKYSEMHTHVENSIMQGELYKTKETLILNLLLLNQMFEHDQDYHFLQGRARKSQSSDADMFQYLHRNRRREKMHGICSLADYYAGGTPSSTGSFGSLLAGHNDETLEGYRQSSTDLKDILTSLDFKNESRRNHLLHPSGEQILSIPATHLAIQNGRPMIQLQLWKASKSQDWEIDFMHMMPIHHAAYQQDLIKLRDVFRQRPNLAITEYRDRLGLSPVLITAINDDLPGFQLLVGFGADYLRCVDCQGRGVLALAARNGSTRVVDEVCTRGILPRSSINELVEAIEHGHTGIVCKIIDLYTSHAQEYLVQARAREALKFAQKRSESPDLIERLETLLTGETPLVSQAVADLMNAEYAQYHQAVAYNTSLTYDTPTPSATNGTVHNNSSPEQAYSFGVASSSPVADWNNIPLYADQSFGPELDSQPSQWLSPTDPGLSISHRSDKYSYSPGKLPEGWETF